MGEDPLDLSRRYCEEFCQDMRYLHCLSPSVEPRVSDHMPQIIDMIKQVNFLLIGRPHLIEAIRQSYYLDFRHKTIFCFNKYILFTYWLLLCSVCLSCLTLDSGRGGRCVCDKPLSVSLVS